MTDDAKPMRTLDETLSDLLEKRRRLVRKMQDYSYEPKEKQTRPLVDVQLAIMAVEAVIAENAKHEAREERLKKMTPS